MGTELSTPVTQFDTVCQDGSMHAGVEVDEEYEIIQLRKSLNRYTFPAAKVIGSDSISRPSLKKSLSEKALSCINRSPSPNSAHSRNMGQLIQETPAATKKDTVAKQQVSVNNESTNIETHSENGGPSNNTTHSESVSKVEITYELLLKFKFPKQKTTPSYTTSTHPPRLTKSATTTKLPPRLMESSTTTKLSHLSKPRTLN